MFVLSAIDEKLTPKKDDAKFTLEVFFTKDGRWVFLAKLIVIRCAMFLAIKLGAYNQLMDIIQYDFLKMVIEKDIISDILVRHIRAV